MPITRNIYLKILLVVVAGMVAAMGVVRFFTWLNDVSGAEFVSRELQALAAVPRIVAEEEDLVMVFGSSMTQAGFSARVFDREMAERGVEVKSFNFGFGGLNPYFQDFVARRIREGFERGDRRLELALIELVPFQLTERRWQGAIPLVDSYLGLFASPRELWDLVLEDPTRGLRVLLIRYMRDSISAEMTTWHFGSAFRPGRPDSGLPEDEEAQKVIAEVGEELNKRLEEDYPDYAGEDWHYGWQGAGTIPEERSEATLELFRQFYDALRNEKRMAEDRLWRVTCCDIEELHFEEVLVAGFIRMVEEFQKFSDRVEVVLFPMNAAWIEYPPEARVRLAALIERVERETGVPVHDFQRLEGFGPEMFSDTTHLSRYGGDIAFTRYLAELYAPLLGETGDPRRDETRAGSD